MTYLSGRCSGGEEFGGVPTPVVLLASNKYVWMVIIRKPLPRGFDFLDEEGAASLPLSDPISESLVRF